MRAAQWFGAEQVGDSGDQPFGGMRQAAAQLAEQVLLGSHDVDAAWLRMLGYGLGEFGK